MSRDLYWSPRESEYCPALAVWRGILGVRSAALAVALLLGLPGIASALSFQVDFRQSTYQVLAGDDFASLLAQHQTELLLATNSLNALSGVSAPVYGGGVNSDYSLLMTASIDVRISGVYTFEVGTDWGRGGAAIVIDNSDGSIVDEFVTTDDLWWNNDWNNPDVFTTSVTMTIGESYTLGWIGFEDCCGGAATIRFSQDGGAFQTLDTANGDVHFVNNPEPGSGLLLAVGLLGLAVHGRKRGSGSTV